MSSLSAPVIVAAAVELADEHGLEKLSMRALARTLGVEAMSLYHHVGNKTALLGSMVDVVFAEFYTPQIGQPWAEQMRERGRTGRWVLLAHPWAVGLTDTIRQPGPAALAHHNATLGCLRVDGFTARQAAHAYAVLDSQLFGFVLQELALPATTGEQVSELGEHILGNATAAELPYLVEIHEAVAGRPEYRFSEEFEFGIELVLTGLENYISSTNSI